MDSSKTKIWIYQSNRMFTAQESDRLLALCHSFVQSWSSHGNPLVAKATILFDRFVVLMSDESVAGASGCSIDKSVHFIKELETAFGVSLLDRSNIAFRNENGEITAVSFKEIKSFIEEGKIKPDTYLFDNTITTLTELEKKWEIKASNSWMARYF